MGEGGNARIASEPASYYLLPPSGQTCDESSILGATVNGQPATTSVFVPSPLSKAMTIGMNGVDIPFVNEPGVPVCITIAPPCGTIPTFCR